MEDDVHPREKNKILMQSIDDDNRPIWMIDIVRDRYIGRVLRDILGDIFEKFICGRWYIFFQNKRHII
jgi:hypothetical protein